MSFYGRPESIDVDEELSLHEINERLEAHENGTHTLGNEEVERLKKILIQITI